MLRLRHLPQLLLVTLLPWQVMLASSLPSSVQPLQTEKLEFEDQTSVHWVAVPLVVRGLDASRPLHRDDVRLLVDGREVHSGDLHWDASEPSTLLLFQDLSGSMANGGKLEASRRTVHCLLDQARSGDRMAMVTFAAGRTFIELPITDALTEVPELVSGWRPYGSTALHDAVSWIPEVRLGSHHGLGAVLVTDGVDNASQLDPDAVRDLVQQADVPVYVVALRGSRLNQSRPKHWRPPSTRSSPQGDTEASGFAPYGDILRRLAAATGGRYFDTYFADDVDAACQAIIDDIRSRYLLSFPLASTGDTTFHPLSVSLPGRRVTLRHRSGYVGPAPAPVP